MSSRTLEHNNPNRSTIMKMDRLAAMPLSTAAAGRHDTRKRRLSSMRLSVVFLLTFVATAALLNIYLSHEEKMPFVLFPRLATTTNTVRVINTQQQHQRRRLLSKHFDPKTVVLKPPPVENTLMSQTVVQKPPPDENPLESQTVLQKSAPRVDQYPYYPLTFNIPNSGAAGQQQSAQQQDPVPLQQQQQIQRPPTIYTFWAPVPSLANGDKGTGMTDETDKQMLKLWKQAWEAIGWEARILTIQDAQQDPRYDAFYEKLQSIPLWGKRRKGANREYNQWCYIRWLAMSAVGGGWMSDYDVLPVRKIDYYQIGKFTVHEPGVPSLLSGTQEEWSKMAWAILENGLQHNSPEVDLWSDMMALADLQEQQDQPEFHYAVNKTVLTAILLLTGKPWTKDKECHRLKRHDAIHFSHYSMKMGVLREGERFRDRPRIAAHIMKLFYSFCQS